jgi:hypothetical protein
MAEKFGAILGVLAFTTVVIAGVLQSKSVGMVLGEAIGALIIFYVVGKICSLSANRVIAEDQGRGESEGAPSDGDQPAEGEGSPEQGDAEQETSEASG